MKSNLFSFVTLIVLLAQLAATRADHDIDHNTDFSPNQIERLRLQHRLDYDAPLEDATFIGSHNTFSNSEDGYDNLIGKLNHKASIESQLENGVRVLNFDVFGTVIQEAPSQIIIEMCHGVCGPNARTFAFGLQVVKDWLSRPGNDDEVVLIGIQDWMILKHEALSRELVFDEALKAVTDTMPNMVYTPLDYTGVADGSCLDIPLQTLTKQRIREAGRNVVLATFNVPLLPTSVPPKGCDNEGHPWRDVVWEFPVFEAHHPPDANVKRYPHEWATPAENRSRFGAKIEFDAGQIGDLLEAGSGLIALDYYRNLNRAEGLIWSWDTDAPSDSLGHDCVVASRGERWRNIECSASEHYACQSTVDGSWRISAAMGPWSGGDAACNEEGDEYKFAAPINANLNASLDQALGAWSALGNPGSVWINYAFDAEAGDWRVQDFVSNQPQFLEDFGDTLFFDENERLRVFKIPEDTLARRITFVVRGGGGGRARIETNNNETIAGGGLGAEITASFAIGNGANEIEPGSRIGFIVGAGGVNGLSDCNAKKAFCYRSATGGGGGGSAVLLFHANPEPGNEWEPVVVAGGGGGAFARWDGFPLNRSIRRHGRSGFVPVGIGDTGGGRSGGLTGASGGGGGATHDGYGLRKGGKAGMRHGGRGGTHAINGGFGFGGGGSGGVDFDGRAGGGGGGYRGGNGGDRRQGGDVGRSYVHQIGHGTNTGQNGSTNSLSSHGHISYSFSDHAPPADNTPPIVTAPPNVEREATGVLTPVLLGEATAIDDTDGALVPTVDELGPFPLGETIVVWSAIDNEGNTGAAEQTVTIFDTTPPSLDVTNVSFEANTIDGTDNVILDEPIVTDLADPLPEVTNDAPAVFPLGHTTVTWTATDLSGNETTAPQVVTVRDTTAPVITAPAAVTVNETGQRTPVDIGAATATDIFPVTITNDEPAGGFLNGTTTVTWTATDENNNTATAEQLVTVNNVAPLVAADGAMVTVDEGRTANNTGTFSDAGNDPVVIASSVGTMTQSAGIWFWTFGANDGPNDSQTVTITATDSDGAESTTTFPLTVNNVAPSASFTDTADPHIFRGESARLVFSNPLDPSSADTSSGFMYSYDCENDGSFEAIDVSDAFFSCRYLVTGIVTGAGRIKDKDGGFSNYITTVNILSPQEAIDTIVAEIQSLEDAGVLNSGQANSLIVKLEHAKGDLNGGNNGPATNQLNAFVNEVKGQMSEGVLSGAKGYYLIELAERVLASIYATA